jgi:hypothetical protein
MEERERYRTVVRKHITYFGITIIIIIIRISSIIKHKHIIYYILSIILLLL